MFLINGQEADSISLNDRAIHYGDGLFETIAIKDAKPLAFAQHINRLASSCKKLNLTLPDESKLRQESLRVCGGIEKGVLKWIISRGKGGRGYQLPQHEDITRIVANYDWPSYPKEIIQQGLDVQLCRGRLGHQPSLAGMKHLNRLEQVLLRDEVKINNNHEGIVLDIADNVIEGSMGNLFVIRKGKLYTPSLRLCGIEGVIRNAILELSASWNIEAEITEINIETLLQADEIFFCNSIIGIWPVRGIENHIFSVGPCSHEIRHKLIAENLIAD